MLSLILAYRILGFWLLLPSENTIYNCIKLVKEVLMLPSQNKASWERYEWRFGETRSQDDIKVGHDRKFTAQPVQMTVNVFCVEQPFTYYLHS